MKLISDGGLGLTHTLSSVAAIDLSAEGEGYIQEQQCLPITRTSDDLSNPNLE